MDDIALLNGILTKTADLVDGVQAEDWEKATPCSDYTVKDLVGHIVGWSANFDAAANGRAPSGDPTAYEATDKSAAEFRLAAASIVGGWKDNGIDREVSMMGDAKMPGQMVLDMTMMEYLAHGWDLAKGSGQSVPYGDDEAAAVLERAKQGPMANDEYRGPDKPFGHIVDVPDDAPAVDRFAGFMGRTP